MMASRDRDGLSSETDRPQAIALLSLAQQVIPRAFIPPGLALDEYKAGGA